MIIWSFVWIFFHMHQLIASAQDSSFSVLILPDYFQFFLEKIRFSNQIIVYFLSISFNNLQIAFLDDHSIEKYPNLWIFLPLHHLSENILMKNLHSILSKCLKYYEKLNQSIPFKADEIKLFVSWIIFFHHK